MDMNEYNERVAKLEIEANKLGYRLVKVRVESSVNYTRCKDCKYLTDTRTCIGYLCNNPNKHFKTETAQFKGRCAKACKQFEPK